MPKISQEALIEAVLKISFCYNDTLETSLLIHTKHLSFPRLLLNPNELSSLVMDNSLQITKSNSQLLLCLAIINLINIRKGRMWRSLRNQIPLFGEVLANDITDLLVRIPTCGTEISLSSSLGGLVGASMCLTNIPGINECEEIGFGNRLLGAVHEAVDICGGSVQMVEALHCTVLAFGP